MFSPSSFLPLFLLSLSAVSALAGPATTQRPNVLVFLVDDLGYNDVGANNPNTFYETPRIDRLSAQGTRFTDGYAACPVCSPTRASLLTGLYPQRTGNTDYFDESGSNQPQNWKKPTKLLPAPYVDQLPQKTTTLAEALRDGGYVTFFAGKWHLGTEGNWPEDHGFQINKGGWTRGGPYGGDKYFSPYGNPRLTDGSKGEHLTDRLARETVSFIESHRDKPWLAYFSFYAVHTPLIGRPDLVEKYKAKKQKLGLAVTWGTEGDKKVRTTQEHAVYAAMVESMDQAVGTVLDALDHLGLAENTLVIFTSDNGGLSTAEGHPTSNLPLRGGKGWLYEGGIREPWIIRWPGVTPPGTTSAAPITSPDLMPTLLAAAGLPAPAQTDGINLRPLLENPAAPAPDRALYWHYSHYPNQGAFPGGAIREGKWKLIENYETGTAALYDLSTDLGEKHDLAAKYPNQVTALQHKLEAWRKDVGALMPTARPATQQ